MTSHYLLLGVSNSKKLIQATEAELTQQWTLLDVEWTLTQKMNLTMNNSRHCQNSFIPTSNNNNNNNSNNSNYKCNNNLATIVLNPHAGMKSQLKMMMKRRKRGSMSAIRSRYLKTKIPRTDQKRRLSTCACLLFPSLRGRKTYTSSTSTCSCMTWGPSPSWCSLSPST